MKMKLSLVSFVFLMCVGASVTASAKTHGIHADSTPVTADAKKIVSDYITAIGGMEAVKKLNTISATGNLSVQGMSLELAQKQMAPNKTLQTVTMNGTVAGKTVFNGTKGYAEQMGNRMDMTDEQTADMKVQTSLVEQTDYLTGNAYQLSVQGTDSVNNAVAYKVLVTFPSGKTGTEYYDMATKLLVRKVATTSANGQSVTTIYTYSDYKKVGDVLLPYTTEVAIAGGMLPSFKLILSDIKINEGVTEADFE